MSSTSAVLSGLKYTSQGRDDEFAVTIVSADFYCGAPTCLGVRYSDFWGAEVKRVPVIRIFGSTPAGQKVCLHVHGVFPYVHVPYDGTLPPDKICMTFAKSLNKALNASMGCPESANQHIHYVSLVTGVPFYGYHEENCTFLRIVYYNPSMLNRMSDLLLRGSVLGTVFQPHDAHVPYILQFFIDYNLYGMNQIRFSSVKFRRPSDPNASPIASNTSSIIGTLTTPKLNETRVEKMIDVTRLPSSKLMPKDCERTSTCALEADASAWHILNHLGHRASAAQDGAGNPGIEFIWADERARRAAAGNSDRLTPPSSPARSQILAAESHKFYYDRLMTKLLEAGDESTPKSDTSAQGYPMSVTSLLANQVDVKLASDVTHFFPSQSSKASETFSALSQSDMEFADLLANLDQSVVSNSRSPAEEVAVEEFEDGNAGSGRLPGEDEDTIIEVGTPKPTPEQEKEDEIETFEMSQAWNDGSFDWEPSPPPVDDPQPSQQIPQLDGTHASEDECSLTSSCSTKRKGRYKQLRRKPRVKSTRNSVSSCASELTKCCVRVRRISNGHEAREVCSRHGLSFDGDFPEECSLLAEQEMSYFSRELRSGRQPGMKKIHRVEARKSFSQPDPVKIKPCKVVVERLPLDLMKVQVVERTASKCVEKEDDASSDESIAAVRKRVKFELDSPDGPPWKEMVEISSSSSETDEDIVAFSDDEGARSSASKKVRWREKFARDRKTFLSTQKPEEHTKSQLTEEKPETKSNARFQRRREEFFLVGPSELQTVTVPSPEPPISTFESDEEEERTEGSVDADDDEAGSDLIECSQVDSSIKRWPVSAANRSRFVSFYDFGSPSMMTSPKLNISSSSAELPVKEENEQESVVKTPPVLPETSQKLQHVSLPRNSIPHDITLVPFQKPPRRRAFTGYVKNQEPFWGNVEDYLEGTEGNKARIGTGDLVPVACYSVSAVEPFHGHLKNAMDAARMEQLAEKGILEGSGSDSILGNEELLVALQPAGFKILTPARRPPKRGEFVEKKKATSRPVTSTPFLGRSSVDETPVTGRPSMDPLGITPVASDTPRPPVVEPKKSKRELIKSRKSQINGPTPDKTFNYKVNHGCLDDVKAQIEPDYLTIFSLELLFSTRGDLLPDPLLDPVLAAFYYISHDVDPSSDLASGKQTVLGAIIVSEDPSKEWELSRKLLREEIEVSFVLSETELIDAVVELVKMWDPDILLGFEVKSLALKNLLLKNDHELVLEIAGENIIALVQQLSWRYLIDRAEVLGNLLPAKLSRIPAEDKASHAKEDLDPYGSSHTSEIHLCGRITLNVWRLFKHEIALTSYTFENLYYHVMHERVHMVTFRTLHERWTNSNKVFVVKYLIKRVEGNLTLLEKMDLIGRTCELARLFGIQFYEVLSRGSQFRVESMMLRVAKPANYVPVSPSMEQRSQMRAPECIALIMEPESKLYSDPVVVVDFQSLYPSVIIAYNYCFSTCLGRAESTGQIHPFKFGCTTLRIPPETIAKLGNKMTISPCGVAFVTAEVRRGILPKMLDQILTTRIMVKQSMKLHKGDKALQRVLDARQLGLKLIANVTYGYTSANFSGRMPCVEIGDSVVSKGRETLEKAIKMVHSNSEWNARVVYGDTDSMFILLPGRDKDSAFRIGQEIASVVTKANPKPVKLKFEKVYYPCILQTKKRYVGYKYETVDQAEPEYEAKGIETVRRDGVPAVCKILEKTLRLLFETKDLSVVKRYVQSQMSKVLLGRVNIADLIFAKEFRGVEGYKPGACVPALELTRKRTKLDRRAVPRVGERFPYVVVYGPPGVPLIQLVREPSDVLKDPTLRLNAHYYITKVIVPPLERCLNMMQGVNVMAWYSAIPKVYKAWCQGAPAGVSGPGASTITQFFATTSCPACDAPTSSLGGEVILCNKCFSDPQLSALILLNKTKIAEKRMHDLNQICKSCVGIVIDDIKCNSLDCPLLHFREMWKKDQTRVKSLSSILDAFSAVW